MTDFIAKFYKKVKLIFNEKGQDIVEFALLCAFCVGIGLFARNAGFSDVIKSSFDEGKPELLTAAIGTKNASSESGSSNQQQSESQGYLDYYNDWHDYKSTDLKEISKEERIKADQLALQLIAKEFIGKDEEGVFELMKLFSNNTQNENQETYYNNLRKAIAENKERNKGNGYSSGTLVPLSYSKDTLDSNNGYLWLDRNNNINTIKSMVGDAAEVYERDDTSNPNYNQNSLKTTCMDRLFYSDDMLDNSINNQKTVSLRLHYTNGVVDEVIISARAGGADAKGETMCEGLCLNVTGSEPDEYTVNDSFKPGAGKKDPVRDPWAYLN